MEGQPLNDITYSLDRLQGIVRNNERNPGPLKGVGNGTLFPNNPTTTYPTPAQVPGQTWWRFFDQSRNIDYFYDFTNNRWLSTERFLAHLSSRGLSCHETGQIEYDYIAVPSGTTHDIVVFEIYYVILNTLGAHSATDHFIMTIDGFDPLTNTTTTIDTSTSDTFLTAATTHTITKTMFVEQPSGSILVFSAERIGAPTGTGLLATVSYRQIG